MSAERTDAAAVDGAIGAWAAERRLPESYLARWRALGDDDRDALYNIVRVLRLRTGQFVAAFDLIEELAVRAGEPAATILARDEIRRILDGIGSAPGRARELLEALRAMRFPRLKRTAERIAAAVAALGLPAEIRVVLPRELGSDEVRVEISAQGGARLERLIAEIAGHSAGLGKIAEMVGGAHSDDDEI
jgi:hypothetical protein